MIQTQTVICDCCRLTVSSQGVQYCPRCGYPVERGKEEHFLQAGIHDLQRVASHGGATMSVAGLIQRYQARLTTIQQGHGADAVVTAHVAPSTISTTSAAQIPAGVVANRQATGRVLSWRSFFADQAINIVASLGAFFVLIGALNFVISTTNLLVSFLVLCAVHAVFGIASFITYRFPAFRIVSVIYTVIFALLVPLVGFSAYRLMIGSHSGFSMPLLIALAAVYAAVIYMLLALYQRFAPFAYLGFVALLLADLALASFLNLSAWWWPPMVMALAFLALPSLQRPSAANWLFTGRRAMLRTPARNFMNIIIIATMCSLAITALYSFNLDTYGFLAREMRFAILAMALLLLTWTGLSLWLSRRTRDAIVIAFLFLITVLAGCYAFDSTSLGYALAMTGVAVLYHACSRFGQRFIKLFGKQASFLDQLAAALVCVVPFSSSPLLLAHLFASANPALAGDSPVIAAHSNVWLITEFIAIAVGFVVVLDIVFRHAVGVAPATRATWAWLLVINGFLLHWEYGVIILLFHGASNWFFVGLTLACIGCAVVVRRRWGEAWANPLDVVALCSIVFSLALSLGQNLDIIGALLLSYATLLYVVLLYQRRQRWLFLPFVCALFALLPVSNHPFVLLLIGVVLPLIAVVVYQRSAQDKWTWPLLATGIVYAVTVSIHDFATFTSVLPVIAGWHVPPALDLTLLALTWYVCAALAQKQLWLMVATIFAVAAAFMPGNTFWALVGMVAGPALLGVGISYRSARNWALPFYATAFFAALAAGIQATWGNSNEPFHGAFASMMVWHALIVFAVLIFERQPRWIGLPMGLAAWAIGLWHPSSIVSTMLAYSALCALVFVAQFVWNVRLPVAQRRYASVPHVVFGLGGQALVILTIIGQGGLTNTPDVLTHAGAAALLELTLLLAWYGYLNMHNTVSLQATIGDEVMRTLRMRNARVIQHWCYYSAGFLFALAISWELLALGQTGALTLTLAPASALIVMAPLLMHDKTLPQARQAGHLVALIGAILLLAPALWLSFSDSSLVSSLVLLGEALVLLLLGIATRSRVYILSSAGLLIVGTLRMLFLASPPALALMVLGGALLAVAMLLFLVRHRLKIVWAEWE